MAALFADLPEAIANTERHRRAARISPWKILGYEFPDFPVPDGRDHGQVSLRADLSRRARQRYGADIGPVRRQLEKELDLISRLGFAGYFLIVADIVKFARERGHPGPGPGQRGQQRGLLCPGHHGRRSDRAANFSSSVS